ncbi:MAG TPA: hypothetical protein VJN93_11625 [Candidatus Acidoferrum sp.]|nr:hypothetical protein [Candidatus Acidoferrum sp.]
MSASLFKLVLLPGALFGAVSVLSLAGPVQTTSAQAQLDPLIERTSKQVANFLDFFSETNCTEHVLQEKLGEKGNVLEKANSTFDYLVILSTDGGDLSLTESRIVPKDEKENKKPKSPLLISNGFSMLFLVFHPYYADSFQFSRVGEEVVSGETLDKVRFQHIPGMRSPAALAVSGREYPLDLSGTAWIEPSTGVIVKLTAGIDSGMEDVGLRSLRSEMDFGKVTFHDSPTAYWLPSRVIVDVESRHQHWRNTHEFTAYRRFSVDTKQQVATK